MDSKNLLTTLIIVGLVMIAFSFLNRGNSASGPGPAPFSYYATVATEPVPAEASLKPQTTTIGGADKASSYLLGVETTNVTAGIVWAKMNVNQYAQTVRGVEPLTLFEASPKLAKPFSTLGIHITMGASTKELPYGKIHLMGNDGKDVPRAAAISDSAEAISRSNDTNMLDSQYIWKTESSSPTDVVYALTFEANEKPVAKISKHFHVDPASYEITVTHSVQNLSDDVIHVRIDQTGAPELPRDDPQGDDRYYHGMSLDSTKQTLDSDHGFNMTHLEERKLAAGTKNAAGVVENVGTVPIGTGSAKDGQFFDYTKNPQLWLASSNRFFTAIVRPLPETDNTKQFSVAGKFPIPEPGHLASANIDLMSMAVKPANDESIMRLTGRSLDVAKGATVDEPLAVYLGPKKRDILKGDLAATGKPSYFYAVYDYLKLVQFNTCALYSYCVVDQLALAILWVLDFLTHTVAFGNYGIAIMILVIVVRALMHPLTRASQMNMAKMGKQMRDVQPQLDAMKKRYADNKKRQSEEMMRIYRENKINPAGGIMGCLPMLIQMPIWAALYAGLRSDIDLRHAAFIPGWINDMASPDTILPSAAVVLGHPLFTIPLVGWDVYGLNLLPILLAGVFYFQMKVTSATQPKAADEQQAQMQKMSQYMIFMFPLFLYNAPSGLNLYIFASTMGGLLDTYIVRKALKKQGILTQSAALLPTKNDAAAND